MKEENHIFQGLKRDNHPIRQESKFLWDAHNIRITNREDNTLFTITNEKGTSEPLLSFEGYYVGHCVLGKYLVVFTAYDDGSDNYIYRVEKTDTGYKTIILFYESDVIGGWDPHYPIEAIGVYETELIQKVYWTDGINQPRVINIVKPELKLPEYIEIGGTKQKLLINGVNLQGPNFSSNESINNYFIENYPNGFYTRGSFDFVREISLNESIQVYRGEGNGLFSPGTIQYAFSYYNKYEQESNIFYTTPIYYISPTNRGGNPEETVSNFFTIEILGADMNFEYVRIYSIHRTSLDAIPVIKIVEDIPIIKNFKYQVAEDITFVDNGTKGSTIDPTQLLYVGGKSLVAGCITSKDNTLFLGNIELLKKENDIKNIIKKNYELDPEVYSMFITDIDSKVSTYYHYSNHLNHKYYASFKANETYRCGVQYQTSDGTWSNPIFIKDAILNINPIRNDIKVPAFRFFNTKELLKAGVKRLRTCIVFPKTYERDIICQGVLCPTVYSAYGRNTDSSYSMASWFFRPTIDTAQFENANIYNGASIQFQHNKPLFTGPKRGAEIQNMIDDSTITDVTKITSDNYNKYKSYYFVDENIVTFHSPDLEFDPQLQLLNWSNTKLRIIGMAPLGAISGDIDIQTKTPVVYETDTTAAGFIHESIGYQTRNNKIINGGLISGLFYESGILDNEFNIDATKHFMVYPWNRSGSLNNDSNRPDNKGTKSAVLLKKVISNLKYFQQNIPIDTLIEYNITTPTMFSDTELSIVKLSPTYLKKDVPYMGNVDTMVTTSEKYPFYVGGTFHDAPTTLSGVSSKNKPLITNTTDPVRIKYKSSPHLVFSLSDDTKNQIRLLPRHASIGGTLDSKNFTFPKWQNIGSSDGSNDNKNTYDGDILFVGLVNSFIYNIFSEGNKSYEAVGSYIYMYKDGKVSIGYGVKYSSGKTIFSYKGHEGKILRIVKNYTRKFKGNENFPGISKDQWKNNIYIGETKYYRVVKDVDTEDMYCYILKNIEAPSPTGTTYTFAQSVFGNKNDEVKPYLLLAEIYRTLPLKDKFGGTSEEAKKQNLWIPAGRAVTLRNTEDSTVVPFEYGDTWYSRYDCLKTYPFTQEDENKVVEIGSFMCETRVNIDGRYDRNRGQLSNLNMTPQNFNLLNNIYSQKDNYFNYRILDDDYYKQNKFSNQITWSKEKHAGEDIDTWTNITLANTLDMDGERGEVTALKSWNEYLLGFQERSLSRIMFNSRIQIPVTDGVPIEITNGGKVDGSNIISDAIGCNNKWSIVTTPYGVYFLDSTTDNIYNFNGKLNNLSESKGMNWWARQNHSINLWQPVIYNTETLNGVRTFYDSKYKDVYFTPGPVIDSMTQPDSLCFSEFFDQFVSLMSYGGTQAMFNYIDGFYSLKSDGETLKLYQNFTGKYNNIFGKDVGWSLSFISNENPTITKIFDTIEMRADIWDSEGNLLNICPISYIGAKNEYQEGLFRSWLTEEEKKQGIKKSVEMKKRFRVWRGLIPRNKNTRQRMRNLWSEVSIGRTTLDVDVDKNSKVQIHDISINYTV